VDRAFTLGPALTHYRFQRVYVVSSRSERITLTLAHFPLPLFHFAASDLPPPPTPDPSATRPFPTLDGTAVRGPSVAVVGTGEGKTELAGGVKGLGGEVVWETV
jgi:hypothetical protein